MDGTCPFCQKLAALDGSADDLVWQFPHSVAFLGSWQYYQGYCVLVSKMHASELFELDEVTRRAFLDEMTILAEAIASCWNVHKMNYELLGNQVPHLHWHLFPRSMDDPNRLQPVWLEVSRADGDPALAQRLATGRQDRLTTIATLRARLQAWRCLGS